MVQKFFKGLRENVRLWYQVYRLIWQSSPLLCLTIIIITLLTGLIPSMQLTITGAIIQNASEAVFHPNIAELFRLAMLFGVLQGVILCVQSLLGNIQLWLQTLLQLKLTNTMGIRIMSKAIKLDLYRFEDHEFYDALQRANRESLFRPYQIFTQLIAFGTQITTILSVLSVLVVWDWRIGLVMVVAPLPALVIQMVYGRKNFNLEYQRAEKRRYMSYWQMLLTDARSVKELQLFQLGGHFLEKYKQLYHQFYHDDSRLLRWQMLIYIPLNLLSDGISAGLQVYIIFVSIVGKQVGLLAAYIQAISVLQHSLEAALQGFSTLYQNNLFINTLFDYLAVPDSQILSGTRPFPQKIRKGIEFRHVSFCYPGTSRYIIKDLNILLESGKCVALVGSNGAGKTTLVKLLTRLYEPTDGEILIDDVPLKEYDLQSVRSCISAIFQDFVQYSSSAYDNIGYGAIEAIDDEMRICIAAEQSEAAAFINEFPEQYQTMLGRVFERGQQLSGGQWQKIALARAFVRRASIVILDEPTASIDAEAETKIFNKLKEVAKGATSLVIAHRFSTVRIADRILVLENGQIIEDGSHDELLQLQGRYAYLFNLQASAYK
jgi:ATP-binding cassette subfamily B protein